MSKVLNSFVATAVGFNPKEWKYHVIVDFSSSMLKPIRPGYSRANQAKELAFGLLGELNSIGVPSIELYRFNNGAVAHVPEVSDAEQLGNALVARVVGGTPLDLALNAAFDVSRGNDQKDAFIILLDGQPDSRAETERVIINYVNTLQSAEDALILPVQIGDEPDAYEWLKTDLDENLRAKFDVIYTVTSKEFGDYPSLLAMFAHALAQSK